MVFSDSAIMTKLAIGSIEVHPFNAAYLNPASMDLTLSPFIRVMTREASPLDLRRLDNYSFGEEIDTESGFNLLPKEFILGCTVENIKLGPEFMARVEGKSSLARVGLAVHITGGYIDPGFAGQITLEIYNHLSRPVTLYPGMRIAQIAFQRVEGSISKPYKDVGSYYGQAGPTPSKYQFRENE